MFLFGFASCSASRRIYYLGWCLVVWYYGDSIRSYLCSIRFFWLILYVTININRRHIGHESYSTSASRQTYSLELDPSASCRTSDKTTKKQSGHTLLQRSKPYTASGRTPIGDVVLLPCATFRPSNCIGRPESSRCRRSFLPSRFCLGRRRLRQHPALLHRLPRRPPRPHLRLRQLRWSLQPELRLRLLRWPLQLHRLPQRPPSLRPSPRMPLRLPRTRGTLKLITTAFFWLQNRVGFCLVFAASSDRYGFHRYGLDSYGFMA